MTETSGYTARKEGNAFRGVDWVTKKTKFLSTVDMCSVATEEHCIHRGRSTVCRVQFTETFKAEVMSMFSSLL